MDAPVATRRDAMRNRERLLAAAAAEISEHGEAVAMASIAGRAEVGVGTLYRHFPTREALLAALTARAFALVLERARSVAAQPGPAIDAIAAFLDGAIAQRRDLILPLHGGPPRLDAESRRLQREIRVVLDGILARGRADETIREDVVARDVVIAGARLAQPLPGVAAWDPQARRQAGFVVAGLMPRPG